MIGSRHRRVVIMLVFFLAPRAAHPQAEVVGTYPVTMTKMGSGCFDESFNWTSGTFEVKSATNTSLTMALNGGQAGEVSYDAATRRIDHTFPGNIRFTGSFTRIGNTMSLTATMNWVGLDCIATVSGSIPASDENSGETTSSPHESAVPIEGETGGETGVPPPTVIGSGDPPPYPPEFPDDSGDIPLGLLIGLGAVGTAVGLGIRELTRRPGRPAKPAPGEPRTFTPRGETREGRPQSFGSIPSDAEINKKLGIGDPGDAKPTEGSGKPTEPEDPIDRAKELGKKAVTDAKAAISKGKVKPETSASPATNPDDSELARLKREQEEWQKTRNEKPDPSKEPSELEKLKAEAKKKAEEEEYQRFLEENEREQKEWEAEQEQARKDAEQAEAERIKREIEAAEAERERARKEAEAAREKAAREAAEEAEAKVKREANEKEAREAAAREEAEAVEAEKKAAEEEAKAEAEKKAAEEKAKAEAEDPEVTRRRNEARARLEAERQRLRDLGFTEREIWERQRDLGMGEYGIYERSAARMGRPEFIAEWLSFGADKTVDLLSSLTGETGSRVKDVYVGSKYFLGQAVGDLLPGGAGVTKEGIALGVRDAVVELGWNKFADWIIPKVSKIPEGYDISLATTYWPEGTGLGNLWAKEIRGTAYGEAIIGLVEGTWLDVVANDRAKNLLKGNDQNANTNAMEKYFLGFKD